MFVTKYWTRHNVNLMVGIVMEIGFCLIFNPYFSLGDNYCDTLFDNAECLFDLGDCQVGVSVSPTTIP